MAINLTDMRRGSEIEFYERMLRGELGYNLVLLHRGKPLFDLLGAGALGTSSQRFINPEIALFERIGRAWTARLLPWQTLPLVRRRGSRGRVH